MVDVTIAIQGTVAVMSQSMLKLLVHDKPDCCAHKVGLGPMSGNNL